MSHDFANESSTGPVGQTRWDEERHLEIRSLPLRSTSQLLERREDAKGKLASRANRVAREQSSEVDDFERVSHVRDIALKPRGEFFTFEKIGSHRKVLREVRIDAAEIEIEMIDHRLTVFCRILLGS
jgi:hypothetical protein